MMNAFLAFVVVMLLCVFPKVSSAEDISFFARFPHVDRSFWYLSHGWTNGEHQSCEWRAGNVAGQGGRLVLHLRDNGGAKRDVGCAQISSKTRMRYGRYEARMRTAKGSGLNTAFYTYTGPPQGVAEHDEIDFEFLGKEPTQVEVNFHRNGVNKGPFKIELGFDASADFHDYAFEWLPDRIRWFADGALIFETPEGADVPKNAGKLVFSLWSGSEVARGWLGDFRYGAPVSAEIERVSFMPLDVPFGAAPEGGQ